MQGNWSTIKLDVLRNDVHTLALDQSLTDSRRLWNGDFWITADNPDLVLHVLVSWKPSTTFPDELIDITTLIKDTWARNC
jgi:hypothetical protein